MSTVIASGLRVEPDEIRTVSGVSRDIDGAEVRDPSHGAMFGCSGPHWNFTSGPNVLSSTGRRERAGVDRPGDELPEQDRTRGSGDRPS